MADRPNILFLFSDQHRGDWLPYDRETRSVLHYPNVPIRMDSIRNLMDEGVTFSNNISNSPLCAPARACLASGKQYDRCGVYNNYYCLPTHQPSFYSVLRDGGYEVCGVGKFDLHKPIFYWGEDGWIDQLGDIGFTRAIDSEGKYDLVWSSFYAPRGPYSKYLHSKGLHREHVKDYIRRYFDANDVEPTPLPEEAYADNWVTSNAIEQLREISGNDKPWFLMVNFSGPHNPWDVTERMKKRWENTVFPMPPTYTGDRDTLNSVMQNYAAMLENIDRNIGLMIEELKKTGQYDNTYIIYAADHGEMMGDRNRYMKSVPYNGALRIPLVMAGPGLEKGIVRNDMVQLHDLAQTICDFAGLSMPSDTDSVSLKPLAEDRTVPGFRDYQVSMLYNSIKYTKPYTDYEEYDKYRNLRTDNDYIEEFNQTLKMELPTKVSMKKFGYRKDWKCIISGNYKLIEYTDGTYELYDIANDYDEMHDISAGNEHIIEELRKKYDFIPKADD